MRPWDYGAATMRWNSSCLSCNSWLTKASEVRDYFKMFEHIIPEVLKEYDPDTFYWPASPSSGGGLDEPNDEPNRGDVHYWDVWHGKSHLRNTGSFFRYLSEFGFQSFPVPEDGETFTDDPEEYNAFSYMLEKHQRKYSANGKIMSYMEQTYKYPSGFDTFFMPPSCCRLMPSVMGWSISGATAAAAWEPYTGSSMTAGRWHPGRSIDYEGRLEGAALLCKAFFAPVLLSCEEAKSVEIRNEEDNLVLSDNFFDMNAGVKRVRVLEGNTDKLMVRSVFDIK